MIGLFYLYKVSIKVGGKNSESEGHTGFILLVF